MGPLHAHGSGGSGPSSIADVAVEWPGIEEIVRTLTLQAGFNTAVVVTGTTLLGIAGGLVGSFALLRKRALMSDALSHATLPGIAMAFIVGTLLGLSAKSLPVLLGGAAVTGVLGVICVQAIVRNSRLHEDSAIGAVLSVFFGIGIVLLSYVQTMPAGNQAGLERFIYGQTAAMSVRDAVLLGSLAVLAAGAALAFFKEFRLVCFDADFARIQGWPVTMIDLAMMSLVVLVVVTGLQAVGLILVIAMLIIPPAAARLWTDRLWIMTALAAVIGGLSGYVGSSASALLPGLPAGSVIVLSAGALFALSLLVAPNRGVIASLLRRARLGWWIAREHLLRALYEAIEAARAGRDEPQVTIEAVRAMRRFHPVRLALLLRALAWGGRVELVDGSVRLTQRGLEEARRLTRNHRLWEEYLVTHAEVAPSHVDRSADMVEHVLSPGIVADLERSLRARDRLIAPSVHPLGAPAGGDGGEETGA